MNRTIALLGAAILLTVTGCKNAQSSNTLDRSRFTQAVPPHDLIQAHNDRADRLDNMTARGILSLRFPDPKDNNDQRYEQGDLNLQLRRPNDVAVVLKKLGETLIWLGSNTDTYWLIDDLESKVAVTGAHSQLTPDKLALLALPLSPLNLPLLLGLEPIDQNATASSDTKTGDTLITFKRARVTVLYRFATGSTQPNAIELRGPDDQPIITAFLTNTIDIAAPSDPFAQSSLATDSGDRFPSKIRIQLHDGEITITMTLDAVSTKRPLDAAFDLDLLIQRFTPERVYDLDDPADLDELHSGARER